MKYFVKAKWPLESSGVGQELIQRVPTKRRFDDRDAAFEWMAQALTDGATSVTIRPNA